MIKHKREIIFLVLIVLLIAISTWMMVERSRADNLYMQATDQIQELETREKHLQVQADSLQVLQPLLNAYQVKSDLDDQLFSRKKSFSQLEASYHSLQGLPDYERWISGRKETRKRDAARFHMQREITSLKADLAIKEDSLSMSRQQQGIIEEGKMEVEKIAELLRDSTLQLQQAVLELQEKISDQLEPLEMVKDKIKVSYFGQKRDGKAHGYGVGIWSTGGVYKGEWANNLRHGKGRYQWKDGEAYEGDYVEGRRTGHGIYYWKDGEYYEGSWLDDKRHGQGIIYHPDHSIKYQGQWRNDKFIAADAYD